MNIILIILVFGVIVFFHEFGVFHWYGTGYFFNTEKGDEIFPAFTADWWVLHDDGGRW